MPAAFGQFYGKMYNQDKKLTPPLETVPLIRDAWRKINVCCLCRGSNRWAVIKASMNEDKFNALEDYRTRSSFSVAERAALDYATELTEEKKVNPSTFVRLPKYYSERAICEIVWLVASEHLSNLTNLGFLQEKPGILIYRNTEEEIWSLRL